MYARDNINAGDKPPPLFAVSGLLWRRSLIMVDVQSRTLWHQLTGRAMAGPLKDETLQPIPAMLTDWSTWRKLHPDTTVVLLTRTSYEYDRRIYDLLGPFVIGAHLAEASEPPAAKAWPFRELQQQPVINDQLGSRAVVVAFDPRTRTANVFQRRLAETSDRLEGEERTFVELTFVLRDGEMVDRQTGSRWNRLSGEAVAGRYEGRRLARIAATISYLRPWRTFFPEGQVYPEKAP